MSRFDLDLRVERSEFAETYRLFGREPMSGDRHAYVQPVTLEVPEHEELMMQPFLEISERTARMLMNELWHAGLRPADVGSEGERAVLIQSRDWAQSVVDRLLTKARF
jgi:hypothetical protein